MVRSLGTTLRRLRNKCRSMFPSLLSLQLWQVLLGWLKRASCLASTKVLKAKAASWSTLTYSFSQKPWKDLTEERLLSLQPFWRSWSTGRSREGVALPTKRWARTTMTNRWMEISFFWMMEVATWLTYCCPHSRRRTPKVRLLLTIWKFLRSPFAWIRTGV